MYRNSEFTASFELANDARQRADLMRRDAAAREALRRACITKNDRRRARNSKRAAVLGVIVGAGFVVAAAYTVAGFLGLVS
jgi:hypothetical protein